jgi:hypothetical protein
LSCGGGDTQLEPRAKISAGVFAPALEVALDRAAGDVEGNNGARDCRAAEQRDEVAAPHPSSRHPSSRCRVAR